MNDEFDPFSGGDADLEHSSRFVSSDQHDEIVELEHSDRISLGVQHVVIGDPVLAGTRHNHRIHIIKLA